jgi:hypothetical protein
MTHPQHSRAAFGAEAAPQQIVAIAGRDRFEINITLWGEGDLKQNGIEIARVEECESRLRVLLELMKIMDMRIESAAPNRGRHRCDQCRGWHADLEDCRWPSPGPGNVQTSADQASR